MSSRCLPSLSCASVLCVRAPEVSQSLARHLRRRSIVRRDEAPRLRRQRRYRFTPNGVKSARASLAVYDRSLAMRFEMASSVPPKRHQSDSTTRASCKYTSSSSSRTSYPSMYRDTTFSKIFVGGLPYHTCDATLREYFQAYGAIEEAVVITDRHTGKSRGYGFVSFTLLGVTQLGERGDIYVCVTPRARRYSLKRAEARRRRHCQTAQSAAAIRVTMMLWDATCRR